MIWRFKVFYNRICRIISYIPVLWRIYDFDHTSAVEVFKHQLTRIYASMEAGYESRKSLNVKLRKLKILIECCDRLNNDFEDAAWDLHWEKFPRPTDFLEAFNTPKSPACKLDLKELLKYEKVRKAMYKRLFMKIFERNFESFWD